VNCYSCENAAINACRRCAKPYCEEHGNTQFCADCLRPSSALPSFNLYRSALLVLLVGTAVAVFLLVRPPGETTGSTSVFVGRNSATATVARSEEPTELAATTTPEVSPTPLATAAPTESPFIEYVVQDGDNLFDIAEAHQPPNATITEYMQAIANLNGFNVDSPILNVGSTLLLPRPPSQ
jgi:hypothetical protein